MFFLIYFLLLTSTYAQKCSLKTPNKYENVYLCQEKLNSTSLRIRLHFKFNQSGIIQNVVTYYIFTLRILDLIDGHRIRLEDRFEKQISNYVKIDANRTDNHSINIHHLSPGRYEICVNLLNNKTKYFYYRSPNSCLHVPWHMPESGQESPNGLIQVTLLISIIILLVAIAFFIYSLHQYFKEEKPQIDEVEEEHDASEHVKLLVNQHFAPNVNPFELLVRKRIHERYAHRSPDLRN